MKKEKSCGTIIIDKDKVLLIEQTNGDWGFPKGHIIKGESEVETAIRETKEETNLDVLVNENKRYVITYSPKENTLKDVVYFVASNLSNDLVMQEKEISNYKWVDFGSAYEMITHHDLKKLWKRVLKDIST